MLSCIPIAPFDEVVFAADFIPPARRTQKFVFFLFHSEWTGRRLPITSATRVELYAKG